MSEHDLEYMRKKYELELAQIELEESREAKNQVRLRKDAEGNYNYVFTASEENIGEAE
jgi:hypothetical protein